MIAGVCVSGALLIIAAWSCLFSALEEESSRARLRLTTAFWQFFSSSSFSSSSSSSFGTRGQTEEKEQRGAWSSSGTLWFGTTVMKSVQLWWLKFHEHARRNDGRRRRRRREERRRNDRGREGRRRRRQRRRRTTERVEMLGAASWLRLRAERTRFALRRFGRSVARCAPSAKGARSAPLPLAHFPLFPPSALIVPQLANMCARVLCILSLPKPLSDATTPIRYPTFALPPSLSRPSSLLASLPLAFHLSPLSLSLSHSLAARLFKKRKERNRKKKEKV